jgi:uncharacterized damage-inducible protein DinB
MNQQGLLSLFRYSTYANQRVLDAAAKLSDDELNRKLSPSHDTVRQLLTHTMEAEAFFLATCEERPFNDFAEPPSIADIRSDWTLVMADAITFLEAATDETVVRVVVDRGHRLAVWQLLMQTFLHSHHPRGELSIIMSLLGQPLPTLDIILYFRNAS